MAGRFKDFLRKIPTLWQKLRKNWRNRFHLLIREDTTQREVFSFKLSPRNIFVVVTLSAFALIMLQERMARELGVKMGSYTHRANSFHCYEKDFPLLEGYIRRLDKGEDVTYDYEGDWEEMMAEARPEIAAAVEKLKRGE